MVSEMVRKYTPCGGCGATDPMQRCMGCMHPFFEGDWPDKMYAPQDPAATITALREKVAEVERERDEARSGNRYAQLEQLAIKRAEAAEARATAAEAQVARMREALERMVALYESEYDADAPFVRPDWLHALTQEPSNG